ncbi:MAG: M3 family oligoendopeptidase, partial [Halobacteria archaeon]|nr:M3 family oligoendopeptidase [Halobacteria archaeon]
MSSVPERTEIDEEYKWDLESIYATDDDWEAAYEEVEERLDELRAYEGSTTESPETLLEVLQLRDEISREVSKVVSYAHMRSDEDTTNQKYQAMNSRAQTLASKANSASSFIEPEIQELDEDEIERMMDENEELEVYDHYLDDVMRQKPHTRSTEIENVLAELGEVMGAPGKVANILMNADMDLPTVEKPDGEAVEITFNNFTVLQKNPNRDFREKVYEEFYDEIDEFRNTFNTTLESSIKSDIKDARIHNYETSREAALDASNIPVEVYDNLVETVEENLDPLHRHAELKRKALDLDELRMWDIYMPVAQTESPDVGYEEAKQHVIDSVGLLDEDYQGRVTEGLDSRWVDVYESKGKQSGAYSSGTYDTQPFILMNWQDDISSMYTLAHELGHSLHRQLTSETQPYVYGSYTIFVAEVASTFNETLLTRHLLDTVDD